MERNQIIAKLKALRNALAEHLKDPGWRYIDPRAVLEFFERYAPLRDALRSQLPTLLGDLPVREVPAPSKTTDFEGRGYITRQPLDSLLQDMKYALELLAATPAVDVPPMKVTKEGIFFAGQYFDALRQVAEVVAGAKVSVVLIDGYIGNETLDLLTGKAAGATAQILTRDIPPQVKVLAQAFQKQHGGLEIRSSQAFHDRFLVLDDRDFYHFGASIKDLGKRGFMFSVIEEPEILINIRGKFQQEWAVATVII